MRGSPDRARRRRSWRHLRYRGHRGCLSLGCLGYRKRTLPAFSRVAWVAERSLLFFVFIEDERQHGLVSDDEKRKLLHARPLESLEVMHAIVNRELFECA